MKKLLSVVICMALLFSFTACGNSSSTLPDFKDCAVGYKLEVYPKVAFDYKLPDGTIVHIDSIEATLTAKNTISADSVVDASFYPYEVTVTVSGNIDSSFAGRNIGIEIYPTNGYACIVGTSGLFTGAFKWDCYENFVLYFKNARL